MKKIVEPSAGMQELFDEFNARYFASKLKRYTVQVVSRIPGLPDGDGKIERRERRIFVHKSGGDKELMAWTLLHEMAHAATNDFHGRRWADEVKRLEACGAPISLKRELPFAGGRLTKGFVLGGAADALAERPEATLDQFLRWFVASYGGASPRALLRRYPWVRTAFANVKRQFRASRSIRTARTPPRIAAAR